MLFELNKIYIQPIVVASDPSAISVVKSAGGQMQQIDSGSSSVVMSIPTSQNIVLRTSFSSVPVISRLQAEHDYGELGKALHEMIELDVDDEWRIDSAVYDAARYVAAELMQNSFPPPRIFTHGQKSVVFNWSDQVNNAYLTVSSDRISALISTPAHIKHRVEHLPTGMHNFGSFLKTFQPSDNTQRRLSMTSSLHDPSDFAD